MKKKAQFYFLAIMIIVVIFAALITISNYVRTQKSPILVYEAEEIKKERSWLLDYISYQEIADPTSIFTTFSESYQEKIGLDKDSFFLFGDDSDITLSGNRLATTSLSINVGGGNEPITDEGQFENPYSLTSETVELIVDEETYTFTFKEGQNIYYLIKYSYDNQTHIITS